MVHQLEVGGGLVKQEVLVKSLSHGRHKASRWILRMPQLGGGSGPGSRTPWVQAGKPWLSQRRFCLRSWAPGLPAVLVAPGFAQHRWAGSQRGPSETGVRMPGCYPGRRGSDATSLPRACGGRAGGEGPVAMARAWGSARAGPSREALPCRLRGRADGRPIWQRASRALLQLSMFGVESYDGNALFSPSPSREVS